MFRSPKLVGSLGNGVMLLCCGRVFPIDLSTIYPTDWTRSCLFLSLTYHTYIEIIERISIHHRRITDVSNMQICLWFGWFGQRREPWMRLFWSTKARRVYFRVRIRAFLHPIGLHSYPDIDESRDMQQTLCDYSCSK